MPDIVKIFEEHPPEAVTFKSGNKTYTVSRDEFVFLRDSAKNKRQYSPDFFSQYKESAVDSQLRRAGLPTLSSWNDLTEWAASGDISSNYGNLSQNDWDKIKSLWADEWEYSATDADFLRKQNGLAPVSYDEKYENTLLDDQLKSLGLPPSKMLSGSLGEKYTKWVNDSETFDSINVDIANRYHDILSSYESPTDEDKAQAWGTATQWYAQEGKHSNFFLEHYYAPKELPEQNDEKYQIKNGYDVWTGEYDYISWQNDLVSAEAYNAKKDEDEFAFTHSSLEDYYKANSAYISASRTFEKLQQSSLNANDFIDLSVMDDKTAASYQKQFNALLSSYDVSTVDGANAFLKAMQTDLEKMVVTDLEKQFVSENTEKYGNAESASDYFYATNFGLDKSSADDIRSGKTTVSKELERKLETKEGRESVALTYALAECGFADVYGDSITMESLEGLTAEEVVARFENALLTSDLPVSIDMMGHTSSKGITNNKHEALVDRFLDLYNNNLMIASDQASWFEKQDVVVTDAVIEEAYQYAVSENKRYKKLFEEYLTDEQKYTMGYSLQREGADAVEQYAKTVGNHLDKIKRGEQQERRAEWANKNFFTKAITLGVVSPTLALLEPLYNIPVATMQAGYSAVTGEEVRSSVLFNVSKDTAAGVASTAKTKFGKGVIQFIPSFIQNVALSVADVASHGATAPAHAAIASATTFDSTYTSAIDSGADATKAYALGLANAAAEYVFERVSIDKFMKGSAALSNVVRDSASYASKREFSKAFGKALARNLVEQGITEASEEMATEFAGIVANELIMGEDSGFNKAFRYYTTEYSDEMGNPLTEEEAVLRTLKDLAGQVIYAGLQGGVSGILMAGGYGGLSYVSGITTRNQTLTENAQRLPFTSAISVADATALVLQDATIENGSITAESADALFATLYEAGADEATIIAVRDAVINNRTSDATIDIIESYADKARQRTADQIARAYKTQAKMSGKSTLDIDVEVQEYLRQARSIASTEQAQMVDESLNRIRTNAYKSLSGNALDSMFVKSQKSKAAVSNGAKIVASMIQERGTENITYSAQTYCANFSKSKEATNDDSSDLGAIASGVVSYLGLSDKIKMFGVDTSKVRSRLHRLFASGDPTTARKALSAILYSVGSESENSNFSSIAGTKQADRVAFASWVVSSAMNKQAAPMSNAVYSYMEQNGFSEELLDLMTNLVIYERTNGEKMDSDAKLLLPEELASASEKFASAREAWADATRSMLAAEEAAEMDDIASASTVVRYEVTLAKLENTQTKKFESATENLNNARKARKNSTSANRMTVAKKREEFNSAKRRLAATARTSVDGIKKHSAAVVVSFKNELENISKGYGFNETAFNTKWSYLLSNDLSTFDLRTQREINLNIERAKKFANSINANVSFLDFDESLNEKLQVTGDNQITAEDEAFAYGDKIYINLKTVGADTDLAYTVLVHEIAHLTENASEEQRNRFVSACQRVFQSTNRTNATFDALIEAAKAEMANRGKSLTNEEALNEVVSTFATRMFNDQEAARSFLREDKNFFDRIYNSLRTASLSNTSRRISAASAFMRNAYNEANEQPSDSVLQETARNSNSQKLRFSSSLSFEDLLKSAGQIEQGRSPRVENRPVPRRDAKGNPVTKTARTIAESRLTSSLQYEQQKKSIVDGAMSYYKQKNSVVMDEAEAFVKDVGIDSAMRTLEEMDASGSVSDRSIATALWIYANAKDEVVSERAAVNAKALAAEQLARLGSRAGKALQFVNQIKLYSPESRIYALERTIDKLSKTTGQEFYLTEEERQALASAETKQELDDIEAEVVKRWGKEINPSLAEMIRSWRYLAMLSSPKTHFRNIFGNLLNAGMLRASDVFREAGERIANVDQEYRTSKAFVGSLSQEQKDFVDKAWSDAEQLLSNLNKYEETVKKSNLVSEVLANKKSFTEKTFVGKGLNKFGDFVFGSLAKEDLLFSKSRFKTKIRQQIQAQGIDVNNITEEQYQRILQNAVADAKQSTFQEFSALADALNAAENKSIFARLGLAAIFPFKKTSINIGKQSLRYTPLGLAKGVVDYAVNVKNKVEKGSEGYSEYVQNQVKAINEIAQGTTGSIAMALGAAMSLIGAIKIVRKKDEGDLYERNLGMNNYNLVIADTLYVDLAQFAPVAVPFIMGAALETAVDNSDSGIDAAGLLGVLVESVDPITEMSLISSLGDLFMSANSYNQDGKTTRWVGDLAKESAQSYALQFIPSVLSQTAKTFDPTTRYQGTIEGELPRLGKDFANKAGFGWLVNAPKVNVRGEEQKNFDNFGEFLLNFANQNIFPATIRIPDKTEIDSELIRLFDSVGEADVLPQKPSNILGTHTDETTKEKITFSIEKDKEYAEYQKEYGQAVFDAIRGVMESDWYNSESTTDAQRSQAIASVIDKAGDGVRAVWKTKKLRQHYGLD